MATFNFDKFCNVYSIVLFSFTLTLELIVLVMVRMRLDASMIIISLAYLSSFGLRSLLDGKVSYLSAAAVLITEGTMYYFVFEMRRLKDKLSSESLEESLVKAKRTRLLKLVVFGNFLIFSVGLLVVFYVIGKNSDPRISILVDSILLIRGIARIFLDCFMFSSFYSLFFYFVSMK